MVPDIGYTLRKCIIAQKGHDPQREVARAKGKQNLRDSESQGVRGEDCFWCSHPCQLYPWLEAHEAVAEAVA